MALLENVESVSPVSNLSALPQASRRKLLRYDYHRPVNWDFFTEGNGNKPGLIENISATGCLLKTTETIEHRRWIRLVVRDHAQSLYFTAVGRIIRREDRIDTLLDGTLTRHRFGIEFIHALNPLVLNRFQALGPACAGCGSTDATTVSRDESHQPLCTLCTLCHLRRACQGLLRHDSLA